MSSPRYPSYKDSGIKWLGEVPEYWKHASLRHACRRITDGSHFSPKSIEEGKSYVTVRNIDCGKIDLIGAAKISPEDFEQLEKSGCRPDVNDVLFSKDGTVGKVAIVEDNDFVALSSLAIISPENEKLAPKYLYYFLQSANGEKQIESLYAGAALRRITLDAIVGVWLPLPLFPEQQTIAAFLDRETAKIDALIAEQQRLIELLKEKRQAVISHAVTKGLNPNAPMKDSGIEWLGEVPEHWRYGAIKHFVLQKSGAIKTGPFGSHLTSSEMQAGEIKVYNQRNVIDNDFISGENFISEEKFKQLSSFEAFPRDLLITTRGTIGRAAILPEHAERGILHPCLLRIQPDTSQIKTQFLKSLIQDSDLLKTQISYMSNATTIEVIYSETIASVIIPVPPISEQVIILEFLQGETTKLDTLTAEAQRGITLLQERRTALISAAVTGKIDVRGLVSDKQAKEQVA